MAAAELSAMSACGPHEVWCICHWIPGQARDDKLLALGDKLLAGMTNYWAGMANYWAGMANWRSGMTTLGRWI